jgi:hypothetical protein
MQCPILTEAFGTLNISTHDHCLSQVLSYGLYTTETIPKELNHF